MPGVLSRTPNLPWKGAGLKTSNRILPFGERVGRKTTDRFCASFKVWNGYYDNGLREDITGRAKRAVCGLLTR